ncbi:hypothetical protein CTI12_AA479640 [Artemisia annua]|uniref:Uncharacterized protein n=1 Tax=Artemisia annua TaxID=35608 RepID=A0A2U1LMC9_ARTAN|nr:hypothetical protein CTI12_AA479640 [Artemisia annua]
MSAVAIVVCRFPVCILEPNRVVAVTSLRSNKKISVSVNRWKAVKEEMHEDEADEPEDALEALEKKRQREIEQRLAQQIAIGKAKDNANSEPLGNDWVSVHRPHVILTLDQVALGDSSFNVKGVEIC